ncbi:MAG: nucleotidyl transferase AbiEii/AbiGii toxin family protein, partial [Candidatus Margulisbacteria bacterium]|nr:nucleotidyl transferase AbiEii/AbiGii toxin family protein [Candidatus Margulisiibacteriota bacterium]
MKDILLTKLAGLRTNEEKYNVTREFLQELVLQIIDRQGYFTHLAFIGGTALRIIYDLPRFSEDLDFCLIKKNGFRFDSLLKTLKRELALNGFEVEETAADKKERAVLGEFIRFKGLLFELGLTSHKSEKLFIKLEIDSKPPAGYRTEVVMVNKNFLFKVQSYDLPSLFAAKLHAFLFRKYAKGRDYYDLLWFLARKTPVNYKLL